MRRLIGAALTVTVLLAASAAGGQDYVRGRALKLKPSDTLPMTPAAEAWFKTSVQADSGSRQLARYDSGVVFLQSLAPVDRSGVIRAKVRIEYRTPVDANKHKVLSVLADQSINCTERMVKGPVAAYDGQNLTGAVYNIPQAAAFNNDTTGRPEALGLLTNEVVRGICTEGHQAVVAKYGPQWRALGSDYVADRLVSGPEVLGNDGHIQETFRFEAASGQPGSLGMWRSSTAKLDIDCITGDFQGELTFYKDPNLSGEAKSAPFDSAAMRKSFASVVASGSLNTSVGNSLMPLTRAGTMFLDPCEAANAALAKALEDSASPQRHEAETWMSKSINTKGWRLPVFLPGAIDLLSDEMADTATGRRAMIRREYIHPRPAKDSKPVASMLTVLEVDCKTEKMRGLNETTFARNGAKEPIADAASPSAAWLSLDQAPFLSPYFSAICSAQPGNG